MKQASTITIFNQNGHWLMDARGEFGGGVFGVKLSSPGHAASLISRYNRNSAGCSVYVEDGYPDADRLRAMAV